MKWKRAMCDMSLGGGSSEQRCSEVRTEVHLFKNLIWSFKGKVAIKCVSWRFVKWISERSKYCYHSDKIPESITSAIPESPRRTTPLFLLLRSLIWYEEKVRGGPWEGASSKDQFHLIPFIHSSIHPCIHTYIHTSSIFLSSNQSLSSSNFKSRWRRDMQRSLEYSQKSARVLIPNTNMCEWKMLFSIAFSVSIIKLKAVNWALLMSISSGLRMAYNKSTFVQ